MVMLENFVLCFANLHHTVQVHKISIHKQPALKSQKLRFAQRYSTTYSLGRAQRGEKFSGNAEKKTKKKYMIANKARAILDVLKV
jgi:hypothetical protein